MCSFDRLYHKPLQALYNCLSVSIVLGHYRLVPPFTFLFLRREVSSSVLGHLGLGVRVRKIHTPSDSRSASLLLHWHLCILNVLDIPPGETFTRTNTSILLVIDLNLGSVNRVEGMNIPSLFKLRTISNGVVELNSVDHLILIRFTRALKLALD